MSWDAILLNVRGPFRPLAEMRNEDALPLCDRDSVAAALHAAFPTAEWPTPTWAVYRLDEDTAMMFQLEHVDKTSMHISVSGSGNPIPSLFAFAGANGWLVVDVQRSEFIDPADPSANGWNGYRSLLDRVM